QANAGDELRWAGALRYGGELTPDLHFRVYARGVDYDDTLLLDGARANDDWGLNQAGFRFDWEHGVDALTLQGDAYSGEPNPDGLVAVDATGGNALGRWTRTFSDAADMQLGWYYDRTSRDFNNGFTEDLDTYDVDF